MANRRSICAAAPCRTRSCSTENDVAHIARALHAGANEYIMKPFDKDIVEAKFQEVGLI
jgi:two-component system, chemotaxis family, chemotaxis protein CheY